MAALALASLAGAATAQPHNVIIFVADGLRSSMVDPGTAPALAAVRDQGVDLRNSHAMYPSVTTPNASAIATGHRLGDTGNFGNYLYVEKPFDPPYSVPFAPIEDDTILRLMNERYGGNYLHETSLLNAAHAKGFNTAAIGKLGPIGIQDVTARKGETTIVIDDATGYPGDEGIAWPKDLIPAIKVAGLAAATPDRGLNTYPGAYNMPGVHVANVDQQKWLVAVTTKVILPRFKADGKPFVIVFWSRDPDGTQHNQGDSLNALTPGINGPTSLAAIRNASDNLQALRDALAAEGLDKMTDIIVTADHGFSTISRHSATSGSAKLSFPDTKAGEIPAGFLAIDLAKALGLGLYDASGLKVEVKDGFHPKGGSILAQDPAKPLVVVAPNGGSDLIYLPTRDKALAERIVKFLTTQDYTGGLFVRDDLGPIPGALPSSKIGMEGKALTPQPALFVSFKSFTTGCAEPEKCGVEVADSDLQEGQGMHGTFGRQDTHNFMAAIGPDFKAGYKDGAPVSNADIAPTAAKILDLDLGGIGTNRGRVMAEALAGGPADPAVQTHVERSAPAANGFVTVLNWQETQSTPYWDAAGMPGRVVGLSGEAR
jgi:arylsulfatase A-like enzyme